MASSAYLQQSIINYNRINALKAHISGEQLFEVFQIYMHEAKVLQHALLQALSQQDWPNATNILHQWKGAALNIGLDQLGHWLQYQETNFTTIPVPILLSQLSELTEVTTQSLLDYINPSQKPQ
jgi:HPt (histidine-containing phosphotransfer) domain-containing protein